MNVTMLARIFVARSTLSSRGEVGGLSTCMIVMSNLSKALLVENIYCLNLFEVLYWQAAGLELLRR